MLNQLISLPRLGSITAKSLRNATVRLIAYGSMLTILNGNYAANRLQNTMKKQTTRKTTKKKRKMKTRSKRIYPRLQEASKASKALVAISEREKLVIKIRSRRSRGYEFESNFPPLSPAYCALMIIPTKYCSQPIMGRRRIVAVRSIPLRLI